jgi:hypothetical protein
VPTDRDHTKTLLFERGGRRGDFTERDRLVLNVLQPDHTRLYRAAAARRRAYAALAVLEVDEQTALVVLAVRDTIDVATARAPVLLRAYFFDDVQGVAAEGGRRVATRGQPRAAARSRSSGCPSRKARLSNCCKRRQPTEASTPGR